MTALAAQTVSAPVLLDYAAARQNMIDGQLRPNGINNPRLLDVIEATPRELFMAPPDRGVCCVDTEIHVSRDRVMLRPLVQARLLQRAEILPTDKVLDIACASGYSTALLARLANRVVAVEENADMARLASANLADAKVGNVQVHTGALQEGRAADGPYNVIIINGAIEFVPGVLADQLAEGGRLVAVVRQDAVEGFSFTSQIVVYTKISGVLQPRSIIEATASTLVAFQKPRTFVF